MAKKKTNLKKQKVNNIFSWISKLFDKYGFLILSVVFLAITFNFFLKQSFTHHELDYIRISTWPFGKIIFENYGDQLPMWFIFLKIFSYIFGYNEITLKILSVLIFLSSGLILYKLCKIYGYNKNIILALYLANPLLIEDTAYKPKHWGFLILICLLTLFIYEKIKETKKKPILLITLIFIGTYTNLVYLIFLVPFIAYTTWGLIKKRVNLKYYLSVLVSAVIFILPIIFYYYSKARHQLVDVQGSRLDWGAPPGMEFIKKALEVVAGSNYLSSPYSKILFCIIIVFLIIQFFQKEKPSQTKIFLALSVVFTLVIIMVASSYTPIRFRYINFAIPLFYMAIIPKSKNKLITTMGVVLIALTIKSALVIPKYYLPEDWKGSSAFIKPQLKDNSQVILMFNESAGPFIIEYYLGIPPKKVEKIENTDIFYADEIWIIRRHGDYEKIYTLSKKYKIEDFDNFTSLKLIHLTKRDAYKNSENTVNQLILESPQVEIVKNNKTKKCDFANGTIKSDCFEEDWQKIQVDRKISGGEGKLCLFVHPRNDTKINITYNKIKLSEDLRINTGISDDRTVNSGNPVYMDVYIDNELEKRIINPDIKGWVATDINTQKYGDKEVSVKFVVYADDDDKRHFCFNAEQVNQSVKSSYFYDNIEEAMVSTGEKPCNIFKVDPIWPHNEKKPPYSDSRIDKRWDCEPDLTTKQKIWETAGQSFAVSDNIFHDAIWFHPSIDQTKTIEYNNINIDAKKITGYYGLNDLAADKKVEAQLTFTISANGEVVLEKTFPFQKGWQTFEIPFDKKLENAKFSIKTTNNRWNHFFFNAFLEN